MDHLSKTSTKHEKPFLESFVSVGHETPKHYRLLIAVTFGYSRKHYRLSIAVTLGYSRKVEVPIAEDTLYFRNRAQRPLSWN